MFPVFLLYLALTFLMCVFKKSGNLSFGKVGFLLFYC